MCRFQSISANLAALAGRGFREISMENTPISGGCYLLMGWQRCVEIVHSCGSQTIKPALLIKEATRSYEPVIRYRNKEGNEKAKIAKWRLVWVGRFVRTSVSPYIIYLCALVWRRCTVIIVSGNDKSCFTCFTIGCFFPT